MHHDLLVYDSDEQYGDQVRLYFEAGLDEGEALVAVPGRRTEPLLREALGGLSEQVQVHISEDWYTRPEAVLAAYDATVRGFQRDGVRGVRVAGELPICSSKPEWDTWVRYEAIINRAFADRPVSIMCTCDSRVMPEDVLDAMRHTHPHTVSGGHQVNPRYHEPAEVLRTHAAEPEPLPELRNLPLEGGPRAVRSVLSGALADAGVAVEQAEAMLLAASEVMVNAERHGDGLRTLRVGGGDGAFVCEVSDAGAGLEDPLAGYVPPGAPAGNGEGLWVARQLTRRLDLVPSSEGGLTVRLWT